MKGALRALGAGAIVAKDTFWASLDVLGSAADAATKAPDAARAVVEGGKAALEGDNTLTNTSCLLHVFEGGNLWSALAVRCCFLFVLDVVCSMPRLGRICLRSLLLYVLADLGLRCCRHSHCFLLSSLFFHVFRLRVRAPYIFDQRPLYARFEV